MTNGIRAGDPCGFNKGCSLKFCVGSQVRQTLEEGRRTYRLKRCGNNNKEEDNSPKTLNDKGIFIFEKNFESQNFKCKYIMKPICHNVNSHGVLTTVYVE